MEVLGGRSPEGGQGISHCKWINLNFRAVWIHGEKIGMRGEGMGSTGAMGAMGSALELGPKRLIFRIIQGSKLII